mmetsp:Transcript_25628/g.73725  ORF Transcript_25628/g.73725 Transcript_25628/m.73725 type:complete len:248 (+) Transcript_25628:1979-2722(+)
MMPARDTVAGEALRRSWTSKTILQLSVIGIRSLFAKVRILLSSNTVLRFSIQMASTGPSQMIHVVFLMERLFHFCQIEAKTPGVHSSLTGSLTPYICESVMALGFMITLWCGFPSLVIHVVRICAISVLPQSVGPTSMKPCRTRDVSYNWMTFSIHVSQSISLCSLSNAREPSSMFLYTFFGGSVTLGKMSFNNAKNSGTSSATNLDRFMSRTVRMNNISSSVSGGSDRFTVPLVRSTLRMLRKPKS